MAREAEVLDAGNAQEDRWNKAHLLKIERDLLYATERVLPLVINQAMNGDTKAQKLILDRTIPPLKAVSPLLPEGLPTDDMANMLHAIVLSIGQGKISPTVGLDVLNMVKQVAELKTGMSPEERTNKAAIANTKTQIARLEVDVATCNSTYTRVIFEKELARQRKELEAMYTVLG
jgi:hypothetical protein